MADKLIKDLTNQASIAATDLVAVADPTTGIAKKMTQAVFEAGLTIANMIGYGLLLLDADIGTSVQAWSAALDTWAGKTAPSGTVVGTSDTQTLTAKRITKRTGNAANAAQPTINTDNVDMYLLTAQVEAITSFSANMTGTPTQGQTLWLSIVADDVYAITWGALFEASSQALPTDTVNGRLDVGFVWNTVSGKWRCVSAV